MLYHWDETKDIMENEEAQGDFAREKLIASVANYLGYTGQKGIIVFDAYLLSQNEGDQLEASDSLLVLYTKTGETADERIEGIISQTPKDQRESIAVVTGDNLLQKMVFSYGAVRMTCQELAFCFQSVAEEEKKRENNTHCRNTLDRVVSEDTWCLLEAIRRRK